MIPPCRCSIRAAAGPRPDGSGVTRSTTGHGPDPTHPVAAYVYAEDRKGSRPAGHLAGFRGVLQVDGYDGFKRLALDRADSSVTLAFCWAHMRRGFYEFQVSTKSPLAAWVLAKIGELYAIEAEIRGQSAEHRRQVRQERSRPIVEALHIWLQDHVGRVSAVSDLAKAIRYAIRHWSGLTVFLEDGRVEMDTNVVERAIRPNTLTRKNALFAGNDGGAASLGDCHDTDPDGEVERCQSDGVPGRRAGTRRLGPNEAERIAHAAAVELDSQHIRHDHQPGRLAAGSAAAPIVNSNPAPSPPHRSHFKCILAMAALRVVGQLIRR